MAQGGRSLTECEGKPSLGACSFGEGAGTVDDSHRVEQMKPAGADAPIRVAWTRSSDCVHAARALACGSRETVRGTESPHPQRSVSGPPAGAP